MLLIPATAKSMEESATITQYYTLAQANRRAAEKERVADSEKPNLTPKNATAVLPKVPTEEVAKKESSSETKSVKIENIPKKSEPSANSSVGQNVDFVF